MPLGPQEGFVLSCIDGVLSIRDIAEVVSLPPAKVLSTVQQMVDHGAVEWKGFSRPPVLEQGSRARAVVPPNSRSMRAGPSVVPPRSDEGGVCSPKKPDEDSKRKAAWGPVQTKPLPLGASLTLYDPSELEEEVDLALERRRQVLDTYYRLGELSHYQLLDVSKDADKKTIRSAYFALSKVFHPDTLFGKELGSYKPKMEAVFKQLTEAYEVLGKKKKRAEYDAYLGLKEQTEAVSSVMRQGEQRAEKLRREVVEAAKLPEDKTQRAPSSSPTSKDADARSLKKDSEVSAAPGSSERPNSTGTFSVPVDTSKSREQERDSESRDSGRNARRTAVRERMRLMHAKRLARNVGRGLGSSAPPSDAARSSSKIPPPKPAEPETILRHLAKSLKNSASVTGGHSRVDRYLRQAKHAESENDLLSASNALRLALAVDEGRDDVRMEYERVYRGLLNDLSATYEKQAKYEEQHRMWSAAALSWARVAEGKPDEFEPSVRAAHALLMAKGDIKKAVKFAQHAVELKPDSFRARRILGQLFLAADMKLNARRELEKAVKLDPDDEMVKNLLREASQ